MANPLTESAGGLSACRAGVDRGPAKVIRSVSPVIETPARQTLASLADGLLSIALRRELPEQLKPRTIAIDTTPTKPAIEGKATNAA